MSLLWPVSLPQLQSADAKFGRKDNVIRTEMDDGTVKQRLATTKAIRTFTTTLELTGTQLATFEAFLDDGARVLPFEWTDPVTDTAVMVKFLSLPEEFPLYLAAPEPAKRLYRGTVKCEIVGPAV